MIVKREIGKVIKKLYKQYPVVTITGPRQSGKTTLVREIFNDLPYFNLEFPDIREYASTDPRGFLNDSSDGAVIDEIQRVPELVSYIQGIVDEKRKNSLYVLTGSQQFEISNTISQSLAGRTAIIKLLPFSLSETNKNYGRLKADELIYKGFFPRVFDQKLNPTQAYRDYFETYIERDLRQLVEIKQLNLFQKFVKLCAGRTGQLLNLNNLANDTGISHTTAREWITLLEASYVVLLLQPYHVNIKKRLTKSPKLYFYDVGLAGFLLGIENETHIKTHPLRGNLFENLVIIELLKFRYNQGASNNLNFYRDSNGNEVDVLYKKSHNFIPIEIKAAETFNSDFLKGIKHINSFSDDKTMGGIVVYNGEQQQTRGNVFIRNFNNLTKTIQLIEKSQNH